jgi:hypothetical protein
VWLYTTARPKIDPIETGFFREIGFFDWKIGAEAERLSDIPNSSWFNKYREQNNSHGLTIHFCPSK